jgi:Leucine-rich repeat (LRR) protein
MSYTEKNIYDCTVSKISEIARLADPKFDSLQILRIVSSDWLSSLHGISRFTHLETLNLSSNSIERIDFLSEIVGLKNLNLGSNNIRVISGLTGLYSLEV